MTVPAARPKERAARFSGVRTRVTLAATGVTLLVALIGSALFVGGLHETLEQSLVTSAEQEAGSVVAQLEAGQSVEQATVTGKRDVVVQIIRPDGTIAATDHPKVTVPVRSTPGSDEGVRVPELVDTYAVVAERAKSGHLVVVGVSEEQASRAFRTSLVLLAIAVPVGVALLAVVVWLAIGRALRPVEVMRQEAAAVSSEELHHRLAIPPGDDEIPRLAATLNEMLDRIDRAQQQQRQFVSDASHELRSPLAIVRQMVEVARRHPETTTVAKLADDVWEEEVRMEGLVKALLTLARLDDHENLRSEVVDLDDAVMHEVDRLRATNPGIAFDRSHVSAGQAHGDPVLFGQVIANLLANAARHAAAQVRISLDEVGDEVQLVVEDDGNGVPVADRERIFERFARLDEARAREAGGAGLGLAIVAKVVQSAGGVVAVTESDLGGARFEIALPTSPAEPVTMV